MIYILVNAPPHRVTSKMRFWAEKYLSIWHPPFGQFAVGVPSAAVSRVFPPAVIACGTSAREKNHILSPRRKN